MPKIVAVECLLATKAIYLTRDTLGQFALGRGTEALYDAVAEVVPLQEEDSYMQDQIIPMIGLLNAGKVLAAAETAVGEMK